MQLFRVQPFRLTARALLLFGALTTAFSTAAQEPALADALIPQGVRAHMAALQRVADDNGGNRAAGTPGYAASVRYVEETLREAGYRVRRQPFTVSYSETLAETAQVPGVGQLSPLVMEGSPNTRGSVTAPLALPSDPLGCSAESLNDLQGAVVLIERGTCTFAEKSQNAAAAGAAAALIYNSPDEPGDVPFSGSLGDAPPEDLAPTAGLTRRTGERLLERLRQGDVEVTLELRVRRTVRQTANVLAEPASGTSDTVVMVGAHLDSVPAGPGINDNGSGVGLTLELARQLAASGRAEGVRFAFWGAEELGLLGSSHYVESLSPAELGAIDAYLNFDMVASPNAAPFAYGDPDILETFGEAFAGRGLELIPDALGGRSDHAPFEDAGVRVAGLFSGAEGTKSAAEVKAYGGSATSYDACYHRACDTFRGSRTPVSTRYLDLFADAAADALQMLLDER